MTERNKTIKQNKCKKYDKKKRKTNPLIKQSCIQNL